MRLRDWPPRRIGLMWVIGICLQLLAILVVPPLLGFEVGDPREPWPPAESPAAGASLDTATQETPSSDPVAVAREIGPAGDTVIRISRDSSFVVVRQEGDTIELLGASQDVKDNLDGAGQLGTVLTGIMADIVRAFVVLMVLLFAIPLVLLGVTLTWAIQRRRAPARAHG
jgi:hypothetical protein